MNYLFLIAGLFFIGAGVSFTKDRGKKAVKIMGDLCSAAISNTGAAARWMRNNFILCGAAVTIISLGGIALEHDVTFYAILALFAFAVHMWLEVNYHDDDK